MVKHLFEISRFESSGSGFGVLNYNKIYELSDYAYPYTLENAWEKAIDDVAMELGDTERLMSVVIKYKGVVKN
jgi:hypothetical protein